jgi:CarD family transcriptional regulator
LFCPGDKIFHPLHGAGTIESIVVNKVDGTQREYYVLRIPTDGMVVMVPVLNCETIGVRAIVSKDQAVDVLDSLRTLDTGMSHNWNRRYRENMDRIRSGDLTEVCRVIKGLMSRSGMRGLSSGERKMLISAKQILISEMVLALEMTFDQVEARIDLAMKETELEPDISLAVAEA